MRGRRSLGGQGDDQMKNLYEAPARYMIDSGTFWRCDHGYTRFAGHCWRCGIWHPIRFLRRLLS